jgi:hypothetical protein
MPDPRPIFQVNSQPGIQRDGTVFDADCYSDGRWVRFQRGRPRKVGGYRQITANLSGPSRGVYVNPQQSFNNVFSGHSQGLQLLPISNTGIGAGITDMTLSGFTSNDNNVWQFDTFFDGTGSGNNLLLAHPGQNLTLIDNNTNTPVLGGNITGTSLAPIGVFTAVAATVTNASASITMAAVNTQIGAGQLVTGTGIPSGTTVVSSVPSGGNTTVTNGASTGTFHLGPLLICVQLCVWAGYQSLQP